MLIILLIIAVLLYSFFNVLPVVKHNHVWGILCLVVAVICGAAIVAHDDYHYGMKTETTTKTYNLVSSGSKKMDMLLYQPLGNGKEKVYLYKTNASQKKPTATKTVKLSTKQETTNGPTQLVIKEERYKYKNGWNRAMFAFLKGNNEVKHRTYTFKVNKKWVVLTVKQAKALAKMMKSPQAQAKLKSQIASQTKKTVMTAIQKDPRLAADPVKRADLTKKAAKQAQAQAMAQLIQQVKDKY